MSQQSKPTSFLVLLVVLAVALLLVSSLLTPNTTQSLQYSDVLDLFRNEKVASFTLEGSNLTMQVRGDGDTTSTVTAKIGDTEQFRADLDDLIAEQYAAGTLKSYNYLPASDPWYRAATPYIIGGIVLLIVFFFLSSRANGGPNGMANFTKANARFGIPTSQTVTFQDVAGADEEKEELAQIVDFLQDPKRYSRLGAKIPKGVLLVGPPGTGKTLLARAVAGEAGVSFLSISGSDFVELYVGVGASRVRDLFEQAKKVAPAIVFIDEIDAVGRRRGAGLGGGHDEREQTLNQLLVEMDGFSSNTGVIVIAATNRKDILDPALLRPGRFDRQIYVGTPDWRGREAILKVHAKDKPLADNVNLESLAKATAGFTGADLANLLNEAALLAAGKNRAVITMKDMEEAMIKVIAGPEKRSRVVSTYERKLTAFHEAGHAIAMYCLPTQDPVHMITIVPRGMAGGMTISLPQDDQTFVSKSEMFETIVGFLGGRVAEQLKLDDISTGASNDIQRATAIARDMVSKYAMSDTLGPVCYSSGNEVFIGRDYEKTKSYSEAVAGRIDDEVQSILTAAYQKCTDILKTHDDKLEAVASYLMAHNNMGRPQFEAVMEGKPIPDADVLPIESIEPVEEPDTQPEENA
ncbi:Cell division-associated, ATP-dependent zinc metalloprotease FtsH [Oscillospiraceae bacterium]|nr:Cell division-associated, ATP-dependent zinc metalloprotease FtsH [Oscillospiraceae bacterium]